MSPKKLPTKVSASRGFVLTRVFDAPRSLVFAAWTQPEHLKRWSAPRGFTVPVSKGDLRPGGQWRACMVSERTGKLWLSGEYRKIVPNELLVFTHAWENEDGIRDQETLVTVRFTEVRGKTRVVLRQTGFDTKASSAGHKDGWSECLDRLKELLASVQVQRTSNPRNTATRGEA